MKLPQIIPPSTAVWLPATLIVEVDGQIMSPWNSPWLPERSKAVAFALLEARMSMSFDGSHCPAVLNPHCPVATAGDAGQPARRLPSM